MGELSDLFVRVVSVAGVDMAWNDDVISRTGRRKMNLFEPSNKMLKAMAKSKPFGPAINELLVSLDTVETNEPINRREGNVKQADIESETARSIRKAIPVLGGRK